MSTEATTVLGDRYALEEVIGRGGMADVYRATDRVLDRRVAVKLLRNVTAEGTERARFTAEARTLARLNHPGLVMVLDAGTADDRPYLVMELIDGSSLAECCAETALHLSRVSTIGIQVADALAYAHEEGIVHRDVKPGNVMLGADGRVFLTDFGIARLIGDTARHTATGTTIGSPAYFAPEQVSAGEVTTAADIYSLGLVLLEALTGERAYTGSPTEVALARLANPPAVPGTLPAPWQDLLHEMTALEPAERPTAAQVADSLRGLADDDSGRTTVAAPLSGEPGETRVLEAAPPVPAAEPEATSERPRSDRRGRPTSHKQLWWLGAAAAVLVLVVLVVALLSGEAPTGGGDSIPADVPSRLEEPLQDLHDAVNGEGQ